MVAKKAWHAVAPAAPKKFVISEKKKKREGVKKAADERDQGRTGDSLGGRKDYHPNGKRDGGSVCGCGGVGGGCFLSFRP